MPYLFTEKVTLRAHFLGETSAWLMCFFQLSAYSFAETVTNCLDLSVRVCYNESPNDTDEVVMVDDLDLNLIRELQKNGRESYVDLASRLGVVEGTVRKRIKHLLDRDIIKIAAVPNVRELGYSFTCIMGLQVRMEDLRKVAKNLAQNQHVCYLAFVTGRYDLMAIVVTQSPEELSQFIEKEISAIPSILRTETFVNLDIIKGAAGLLDTVQLVSNLNISSLKKT